MKYFKYQPLFSLWYKNIHHEPSHENITYKTVQDLEYKLMHFIWQNKVDA